ncbi:MAG: hypothetical protein JNL73_02220 [Anaerolineales bacterium]|nr:hypothetical protein [Anaerolineales bacterium]
MTHSVRDHAFQVLLHPITLLAIGVQLLNDHVLRRVDPSPIWGKLGDVTMLIYAPLLFAALVAFVLPIRGQQGLRRVGLAGLAVVAVWFILGKTVPDVLVATNALASLLTSRPSHLILDPTDLLALPALGVAWWIWEHPLRLERSHGLRPFGLAALGVAWLATVATSVPTIPTGIQRVCLANGALRAEADFIGGSGPYDVFRSDDGGRTWTEVTDRQDQLCENADRQSGPKTLAVPETPWQYRILYGQAIERSSGISEAWTRVYDSQADDISGAYAGEKDTGPLDAIVEPSSGNLIVAMGRRGLLLIAPGGDPAWVSLGIYSRDFDFQSNSVFVLNYPITIAILLVPLSVYALGRATLGLSVGMRKFDWPVLITFALNMLFIHPASQWPEREAPTKLLSELEVQQIILAVIAIPLAIATLDAMHKARDRRPRLLVRSLLFSVLAAIIFLTPFGLWAATGFPGFSAEGNAFGGLSPAPVLAIILTVSLLVGARLALRRGLIPTSETASSLEKSETP